MTDIAQWKSNYDAGQGIDCPCCGRDRPEHCCRNCYADMDKDMCWKLNGYCSEKCKTYVEVTLPATRKQKEDMGLACKCDEPQCFRCLSLLCKDDNCPTHTQTAKTRYKARQSNLDLITGPEFKLYDELVKLGVDAVLHYSDGHKTVDIAVLSAKLYIEVDGIQHFNNPDQIERDFMRSHYSDESGFATFYVTNQIVESKFLTDVAKAIAEVVKRRTSS